MKKIKQQKKNAFKVIISPVLDATFSFKQLKTPSKNKVETSFSNVHHRGKKSHKKFSLCHPIQQQCKTKITCTDRPPTRELQTGVSGKCSILGSCSYRQSKRLVVFRDGKPICDFGQWAAIKKAD